MKISLSVSSICIALIISGCGGKPPNPVSVYQPGDQQRSCGGLNAEIAMNESEIEKLIPHEDATGKNVALGVTGAFLIVPLFFMDFKDGEKVELQALRRRNLWLREVAANNQCSVPASRFQFEEKPEEPKKKSCC